MSNRVSFVRYNILQWADSSGNKETDHFRAGVFRQITMTIDAIIQGKSVFILGLLKENTTQFSYLLLGLSEGLPTVHSILFFRIRVSEIIAICEICCDNSLPKRI